MKTAIVIMALCRPRAKFSLLISNTHVCTKHVCVAHTQTCVLLMGSENFARGRQRALPQNLCHLSFDFVTFLPPKFTFASHYIYFKRGVKALCNSEIVLLVKSFHILLFIVFEVRHQKYSLRWYQFRVCQND